MIEEKILLLSKEFSKTSENDELSNMNFVDSLVHYDNLNKILEICKILIENKIEFKILPSFISPNIEGLNLENHFEKDIDLLNNFRCAFFEIEAELDDVLKLIDLDDCKFETNKTTLIVEIL